MQVTELSADGLKRSYRVVVEADAINNEMEKELRAAGENVKIPGFRPGYIPMKILEQRYGKTVRAEVLKKTINETSAKVLNERNLRAALAPKVDIQDYQENGQLIFNLNVEVLPEVPDVDFGKLKLDKLNFAVGDEHVDEGLERFASRNRKINPRDDKAKAAKGDVVEIDFDGKANGKAIEGGSAKNYRLEIGSGQFIEGFEEQIIGMKKGDTRTINVKFPADYMEASLAGQPAEFDIVLHGVYSIDVPEADDEFAKQIGFADVRALREAVRDQLMKDYSGVARNKLKKQLFDQLEELYTFDVPPSMIEMEYDTIWQKYEQAKQAGQFDMEGKSEDELKEEYRRIAQRRVRLGILLAEIGNKNKLQISRDELNRAVAQQAAMFPGQERRVIDFYRNNPERIDDLRGPILEEKAVDFILEKTKMNERDITIEELIQDSEEEGGSAQASEKKAKSATKKTASKKAEPKQEVADAAEEAEAKPAKKAASAKKSTKS